MYMGKNILVGVISVFLLFSIKNSLAAINSTPYKLKVIQVAATTNKVSDAMCNKMYKNKIIDLTQPNKIIIKGKENNKKEFALSLTDRNDNLTKLDNIDVLIVTFTENIPNTSGKSKSTLLTNGSISLPLNLNHTVRSGFLATNFCRAILIQSKL